MLENPWANKVLAVGRKKKVSADLRMSPKDDSVVEKAILNYPLP